MEVASALVVAARVGRLEPSTIGPLMRSLEAFRLDGVDPHDFASDALETALDLGLRVPDAAYVVCARRTGGTLITADRRLFEVALHSGAAVALVGDLAA
jgi:predicted nucleic acid-binding protein